jgi:hypothetical protein
MEMEPSVLLTNNHNVRLRTAVLGTVTIVLRVQEEMDHNVLPIDKHNVRQLTVVLGTAIIAWQVQMVEAVIINALAMHSRSVYPPMDVCGMDQCVFLIAVEMEMQIVPDCPS